MFGKPVLWFTLSCAIFYFPTLANIQDTSRIERNRWWLCDPFKTTRDHDDRSPDSGDHREAPETGRDGDEIGGGAGTGDCKPGLYFSLESTL